jgi:hypothetical protein
MSPQPAAEHSAPSSSTRTGSELRQQTGQEYNRHEIIVERESGGLR